VIAHAAVSEAPAPAIPRLIAPTPYQASFGRVVATLPGGTVVVSVLVDGKTVVTRSTSAARIRLTVPLPRYDTMIRVVAIDAAGRRRSSATVGPVFGLPPRAAPRRAGSFRDARLTRRVTALARAFRGTAAVYVRDLATGLGAAWNARARFPAGSTLKLAIALEALRDLRGPPAHGSSPDGLLRATIVGSDNRAANALEVWFGGSTSGGSARVDALLRTLGLTDSEMFGAYEVDERAGRPIPVEADAQPSFGRGKYTTAWDLSRLIADVYLAAGGRGPLVHRLHGEVTPAEARYLLYLLVHAQDGGKLDRFLPRDAVVAHKAGWISTARHDNGLVFWSGGAFVASVMTWNASGTGAASDVLAGRVAKAALERFNHLDRH